MEMAEMDEVFKALADPSRRLLLDSLNTRNGQSLQELCAGLSMARQSVSKHLAVLEAANLVTTVWRGREKLHYLNAEPINAIADRWISHYARARVQILADLKTALESESMSGSAEFVYNDLHQDDTGAALASADRPGVLQELPGARDGVGLEKKDRPMRGSSTA
jgi:DNA-binding transcriptional ArsR family regulator